MTQSAKADLGARPDDRLRETHRVSCLRIFIRYSSWVLLRSTQATGYGLCLASVIARSEATKQSRSSRQRPERKNWIASSPFGLFVMTVKRGITALSVATIRFAGQSTLTPSTHDQVLMIRCTWLAGLASAQEKRKNSRRFGVHVGRIPVVRCRSLRDRTVGLRLRPSPISRDAVATAGHDGWTRRLDTVRRQRHCNQRGSDHAHFCNASCHPSNRHRSTARRRVAGSLVRRPGLGGAAGTGAAAGAARRHRTSGVARRAARSGSWTSK